MPNSFITLTSNRWLNDPRFRQISAATRGVWVDVMACIDQCHARGLLVRDGQPVPLDEVAELCRLSMPEVIQHINALVSVGLFSWTQEGEHVNVPAGVLCNLLRYQRRADLEAPAKDVADALLSMYRIRIKSSTLDHSRFQARKNIIRLVVDGGWNEQQLIRSVKNYHTYCMVMQLEQEYRKNAGNFFGREGVFEQYASVRWIAPERPKGAAKRPPEPTERDKRREVERARIIAKFNPGKEAASEAAQSQP